MKSDNQYKIGFLCSWVAFVLVLATFCSCSDDRVSIDRDHFRRLQDLEYKLDQATEKEINTPETYKVKIISVDPPTDDCKAQTLIELEDGSRRIEYGNWGSPGDEFIWKETPRASRWKETPPASRYDYE